MLSNRPILELQKSRFDKALETLTFVCVAAGWIIIAISYTTLPDIIPMHYDLKGNIDNRGAKAIIWVLPIIFTAVITGIYFLNKYPHYFNYLVKINANNAEVQYRAATRHVRTISLGVALVFLTLVSDIIISARTSESFLGAWFIPALLILCVLPVIVTLYNSRSAKPQKPS